MVSNLEFLINTEKKLVYEIINQMYCDENCRQDYINAGFEGLIEAAQRFNMFKSLSFRDFCIPYIIRKIENVKDGKKEEIIV